MRRLGRSLRAIGLVASLALGGLVGGLVGGAGMSQAQTLADIRGELNALNGQIQQLRDQLVQSGAAGGLSTDPASALTRLDLLEAELRRLTNRVDVINNDLFRILEDASNRVGDIEFRLSELEGVAPGTQPDAPLLGDGFTAPRPRPRGERGGALTVTEQSDFDRAKAAAEAGDHAEAAQLYGAFLATYPGGPLSVEAQFRRGEALAAQGDAQAAARSFLDAFSGAPSGPYAAPALAALGETLNTLGQVEEACKTFTEVGIRYPQSPEAARSAERRAALRCP